MFGERTPDPTSLGNATNRRSGSYGRRGSDNQLPPEMNDGLSLSLTGAVPDVVVGAALGEPGLHRQHLLGPERLDRRLQRVTIAGLDVDLLSERGVVRLVLDGVSSGDGGWVVTPNVDIARQCAGDPAETCPMPPAGSSPTAKDA